MNLPGIWPFAMSTINWDPYIQVVRQITGESPTRNLDAKGIPLSDPYAYHLIIGDLRLQHYGFLFLERIANLWKIMNQVPLAFNILETDYEEGYALGIVYGSLSDWESTFVLKCTKDSPVAERQFYTLIYQCFEKSQMRRCFSLDRKGINEREYIIERQER